MLFVLIRFIRGLYFFGVLMVFGVAQRFFEVLSVGEEFKFLWIRLKLL